MSSTPPPNTLLKIWCNAGFPEPVLSHLRQSVVPHTLVLAKNLQESNLVGGGPDADCRGADIAFGQPDPSDVINSPRLRWIQLTTAGYTRYDTPDIRAALSARNAVITNSSSVYDEPCAEHVLAMMMAFARRLPEMAADQHKHGWDQLPIRARCRLLTEDSALIVGFGAIGRRLSELLQPFGMNLSAVRRSPTGKEPIRVLPVSQVDDLLPTADHVINILPASEETRGFFTAERFARFKPGAFFYNIGRGDTVDQKALKNALDNKQIASAYLDVTTPEPLPPSDPLWTTPNCYITPHAAGGHTSEFKRLAQHFLDNLKRLNEGQTLRDRILAR